MKDFPRLVRAGAGFAGLLERVAGVGRACRRRYFGIWWLHVQSKILVLGGGDPPLNAAGKTQYATNQAGLKNGTIVDKPRKVCSPDGVPVCSKQPYPSRSSRCRRARSPWSNELNHQAPCHSPG